MSLWETFTLAVKNISGSKMRTFLTMLGIIIGVCAVIVIVGLGNGMAGYMEDSFAEMGTNTLTVSIMGRGTSRTVSEEQMYQIVEDNAGYLDQISPTVSMTGSVKIGSTTYSSTSVSGVGETWFDMKGYEVAQGRGIEYMDIVNRKKVCVVGSYVAQTCFGGNAVGQSLKVGGTTFSIVGVMAQEAEQMEEGGTDDCVYVPYSTAARLSFTGTINSYTVTVTDEEYAAQGKTAIENALYKIFQDEDAYTVVSMAEMLDTMTSMVNMVIAVLAAIAGISLLVGGIGIMNIMLVSVTERTREIGIRKSLGAKRKDIRGQFIIEAGTTSAIGGVLGILVGIGLASLAGSLIGGMMTSSMGGGSTFSAVPNLSSVAVAFGVSVGIGILFGYLPAKKAAALNPIDALRYE